MVKVEISNLQPCSAMNGLGFEIKAGILLKAVKLY
jgi:hypothetical protein